jgi:hypothetical protein
MVYLKMKIMILNKKHIRYMFTCIDFTVSFITFEVIPISIIVIYLSHGLLTVQ